MGNHHSYRSRILGVTSMSVALALGLNTVTVPFAPLPVVLAATTSIPIPNAGVVCDEEGVELNECKQNGTAAEPNYSVDHVPGYNKAGTTEIFEWANKVRAYSSEPMTLPLDSYRVTEQVADGEETREVSYVTPEVGLKQNDYLGINDWVTAEIGFSAAGTGVSTTTEQVSSAGSRIYAGIMLPDSLKSTTLQDDDWQVSYFRILTRDRGDDIIITKDGIITNHAAAYNDGGERFNHLKNGGIVATRRGDSANNVLELKYPNNNRSIQTAQIDIIQVGLKRKVTESNIGNFRLDNLEVGGFLAEKIGGIGHDCVDA